MSRRELSGQQLHFCALESGESNDLTVSKAEREGRHPQGLEWA